MGFPPTLKQQPPRAGSSPPSPYPPLPPSAPAPGGAPDARPAAAGRGRRGPARGALLNTPLGANQPGPQSLDGREKIQIITITVTITIKTEGRRHSPQNYRPGNGVSWWRAGDEVGVGGGGDGVGIVEALPPCPRLSPGRLSPERCSGRFSSPT